MKNLDVVVVGSGFGGGTIACRLAKSGRSVVLLERGRRWRGKDTLPPSAQAEAFPQPGDSRFFWGPKFWSPWHKALGLYEMRQFTNLQGLTAAGVGGGSLIWANVVVEAPSSVFDQRWPDGLTLENLRPYYARAREFLRPATTPGVGMASPDGRTVLRADLHREAARRIGREWQPVELAVNFADEQKYQRNGFGEAKQFGCNFCGMCSAGCPRGAKNTTDLTSIAAAEAAGAEVRPLHQVTRIIPVSGGYRVHFERYTPDGKLAERAFVQGKEVVLSAGSFATTELLLKNKHNGSLPLLSPALGSRFSINGNVVSGALNRNRATTGNTNNGPAITSLIDFGDHAVEDIANPAWAAGIVGAGQLSRILAFLKVRAGLAGSPEELAATMQDLLVYVGVGRDTARGRLSLNAFGRLSMTWPGGLKNEPVVQALHRSMAEIASALGREYVPNVFSTFGRLVTYHPLGGSPMGRDIAEGVVDQFGRVFNYPGLYIADGSIIPTALGRNPAFTIAALAERIAERMI